MSELDLYSFTLTLPAPSATAVAVDYATVDETAIAYADYVRAQGTAVFAPGQTSLKITSQLLAPTTGLARKAFRVVLSNPRGATLGQASSECTISGPPVYPAVPFPGHRYAAMFDSITYANNHWNPPNLKGGISRNEYFSVGKTGYIGYADAILGNVLVLEPALQPNTNPGGTSPHNGTNFAVYSSQVAQADLTDFDPIPNDTLNNGGPFHNIGPMAAARLYTDHYDMVGMMGGTNDLSAGASAASVLNLLKLAAYDRAKAGKWVFVHTITPRTSDLLGPINGVGGYSLAQMAGIMLAIQIINQGLRDWIANDNPPNIFLVDSYAKLLGPTASLVPGNPTDPFGLLSSSTDATAASTPGNYRPDMPGVRAFYDGLHMADPAAFIVGQDLAAALLAAGVPPCAPGMLGPLAIGPNLIANPGFTVSTTPRQAGQPMRLGRAIGLGAPLRDAAHPEPAAPLAVDPLANTGLGYAQGPMPDDFFFWRLYNFDQAKNANAVDKESFSNFNAYTYAAFPGQLPAGFLADSTWPDGAVQTAIVTIAGQRRLRLTVNLPAGLTQNEGFVVRTNVAPGQHGPWDNYGYENSATQSPPPEPPYLPGQAIAFDCRMDFSGLSTNLSAFRLAANFLNINNSDPNTDSAVISGLWGAESFYRASPAMNYGDIANCRLHPGVGTLFPRTPAVIVPTPAAGEAWRYLQLNWQFSFDCSVLPATGVIDISLPRAAVLTGPAL